MHEYMHGLAIEASRTERVGESNLSVPLGWSHQDGLLQGILQLKGQRIWPVS